VPPTDNDGNEQRNEASDLSKSLRITYAQNCSRNDEKQRGDNEADYHPAKSLKLFRTLKNQIYRNDH
jgi:hypothetical protein